MFENRNYSQFSLIVALVEVNFIFEQLILDTKSLAHYSGHNFEYFNTILALKHWYRGKDNQYIISMLPVSAIIYKNEGKISQTKSLRNL